MGGNTFAKVLPVPTGPAMNKPKLAYNTYICQKNIIHTSAKKYNAYICKKIEYIYLQNTKEHKSAIFVWFVFQREREWDAFWPISIALSLERETICYFLFKGDNLLFSLEKETICYYYLLKRETICYFLLKRRQFVIFSLKWDNLLFSPEKGEKERICYFDRNSLCGHYL